MAEHGFRGNQKKVWRFLSVTPDHEPGYYICIQELDGHWEEPNYAQYGPNDNGWRDAEEPVATRVVRMEMLADGSMKNAHGGGYNGDRYSQR